MQRMRALAACAALSVCNAGLVHGQEPPRLIPVYLVPNDSGFPLAGVTYHVTALEDVRHWYGRVLGGRTFVAEPLVVQRSRHTFAELAADNFQAWWPLLQQEFADYGWPWNHRSTFKLLFLTHDAGAWAGSDSENGGIDSVSQAGKVDKGDWGGVGVIGDSSVGGVLAGACPETAVRGSGDRGRGGGTAWWCSGTTYRGTIAHELGHEWGLPHPDAFRAGFRCSDTTAYTNMQCHWEYARERLLDYEIVHLKSLRYFQFDTLPSYTLLADLTPRSASRWRRARLAHGDSLTWIDGRGGGTGYPWAVVLTGAGAIADYALPLAGGTFACDLGLARGSAAGDSATVEIVVAGRPVQLITLIAGHPPQRIVLNLGDARRLAVRVRTGSGAVVLGNARIYRPEVSSSR